MEVFAAVKHGSWGKRSHTHTALELLLLIAFIQCYSLLLSDGCFLKCFFLNFISTKFVYLHIHEAV